MGLFCCCQRHEEMDDYASYSSGCVYQYCLCFPCCVQLFLYMYTTLFRHTEGRNISLAMQSGTSASTGLSDTSLSLDTASLDTFRPPPRPLPYNAQPRYARLQRDGLVSRREKSGLSGELESLRRTNSSTDNEEQTRLIERENGTDDNEPSPPQGYVADSSEKRQPVKPVSRAESMVSIGDDNETCPTCLDGYNNENPKIITQCGHHFHLGCIYEWMERSIYCPICGKEMKFDESN